MLLPEYYPEAVIWDLDGTLIESAPDLARALNTLLNERGHLGHPVADVRPMIGGGVARLIERGFRFAGAPLDDRACDSLVPRFMEIYSACCTQSTTLLEHAREALEHFYHAGVRQGLCTNKPQRVTRQILNSLDIIGYFDSIIGGDSTTHRKPHPLPLLRCLEELETRQEQAIMIGDSGADVGAAKAAGLAVILVPDGYTSEPAESLGADLVLNDLSEVCHIRGKFQARFAQAPCRADF